MPSAEFAVRGRRRSRDRGGQSGGRTATAADVVKDRAPFELAPERRRCERAADGRYEKAALLIHDLGGTPYEMRDLARAFADACYLVRAILLPGHGTVPGDLLDVDYRQWVDATQRGRELRGRSRAPGPGRFRARRHARPPRRVVDAPPDVELGGLVLLAPALAAETPLAWLRAPGIRSQLTTGTPWARLLPDYDPVRYESLPRNALTQRTHLVEEVVAQDRAPDPGVPGDQRG